MTNEDAKRTLQDMWECLFNEMTRHTFEDLEEHEMLANYSKAFEMALAALSTEDDWIPITAGMVLPEHDVICCNDYGDIAFGYLYFDEEENQMACDRDPYVMFGVTAYMEPPKPYKKGGKE